MDEDEDEYPSWLQPHVSSACHFTYEAQICCQLPNDEDKRLTKALASQSTGLFMKWISTVSLFECPARFRVIPPSSLFFGSLTPTQY